MLCTPASLLKASTVEDTHYVAAVVDYTAPVDYTVTPEKNILNNIEAFEVFVSNASTQVSGGVCVWALVAVACGGAADWRLPFRSRAWTSSCCLRKASRASLSSPSR